MAGAGPLRSGDPSAIGPYRLAGLIGEGGQGTVYLGLLPSGGQVAVKWLKNGIVDDERLKVRFMREVEAARRVAGFCTAQVVATGTHEDRPYIVSEYVEGESLRERIERDGPRDAAQLERLAVGTVTALAAIHRAGIVHRDFKPNNVLLGEDGPRVVDFGIARAFDGATGQSSTLFGTPAYMAPEQFSDGPVGTASDVFAWALTLYYAATGVTAFSGGSPAEIMYKVLDRSPDLSEIPEGIRELLAACLAKDPAARPDSTEALLILLDRRGGGSAPHAGTEAHRVLAMGAAAAESADTPMAPAAAPERRRTRSRRTFLAAGGLLLAGTAAGGTAWLLRPEETEPTGPLLHTLAGHNDIVGAVTFVQQRERVLVVSASGDRTLRIWNPETGARVGTPLTGHAGWVGGLASTLLDGRPVVLSSGEDGTVRIWDPVFRRQLRTLRGHKGWVGAVSVGALDGRPVVLSSGQDGTVRMWNPLTGRPRGHPLKGSRGVVGALAFALADFRPIALAGDSKGELWHWDLTTRKRVGAPMGGHTGQINSVVSLELDGRPFAVTGGADRTIRFWDLRLGVPDGPPITGHTGKVHVLAVGRLDGRQILASGSDDGTVRLWDPVLRTQVGSPLTGHTDWVWGLAFGLVNGRTLLASGSRDLTTKIWDPARSLTDRR